MTETELAFASIEQVAPLIRKKKISPVELAELMLRRIERLNPKLNAYISVTADLAMKQARKAEAEICAPRSRVRYRGPLHGIPVSLKDNIYSAGIRTTAGSKVLFDFVPEEDASVAVRLREAGAVLLGKTNMHEFAYGVTSNNPHFGPVRNPWDLQRIPGGSSGGSTAALAAGLCYASIGTDTGGSIRIPAALCGVVGLKPTFGRVSCYRVIALAPSLDHTGPLARSVYDAAALLNAIAGRDPLDPATVAKPVPDYTRDLKGPLKKLRLGWPKEYFWKKLDEEVRKLCEAAARHYEKLGAKLEEVSLPHVAEGDDPSTAIALAEARAYHEIQGWYPARAADYSEESRKRLEMGADIRAVDYLRARASSKTERADFDAAFEKVDAVLAPTVPFAAPPIGEKVAKTSYGEEPVRSALLRLNRPSNYTGLPAISIPCGFTSGNLPVGLQLIGRAFDEARLLQIARAYEEAHDWYDRRPPLE